MLQIENITKIFTRKHGPVTALNHVSIGINDGEFVAIIGPSGSGKSTLLLALGGMGAPSEGRVLYNTASVYDWAIARRAQWRATQVGFVFQSFNLVPYLTVYQNVSVGLALSGDTDVSEAKIVPILERMKIADRQDHLPSELSVGQQQRVALARALVKNPQIILADEPTGNLDRETAGEIIDLLKSLNHEGRTVIIITHDELIARETKRRIRIVDGAIVPKR
jgi:putative ABC transport system ATP-binding protein